MDEPYNHRRWDDLIPDALGLVFRNLPLQEILTVVPRVCKSWYNVVAGPYIWQEIDVEDWSYRNKGENLDRMLHLLITRSSGSPRSLSFIFLRYEHTFSFIAEHWGSLETLRMPCSDIPGSMIENLASKMSTVTSLDVSDCMKMGASELAAIGKNCRSLWQLKRNIHPMEAAHHAPQDEEAQAIADTMPNLTHLEIAYLVITTESFLGILSACPKLELLNVRGCWKVRFVEKTMQERFPRVKILGPIVIDVWDDDCTEYSDDYTSLDGDDDLQYEPFYGGMVHEWPPSP